MPHPAVADVDTYYADMAADADADEAVFLAATYTHEDGWHPELTPYSELTPELVTRLHRGGVTAVHATAYEHVADFLLLPPTDTDPPRLVRPVAPS